VLNRRQARWVQELAGIDFRIYYRPASKNGKPDALSRHSEYRPEKVVSENQPITTVLQKNHFAEPDQRGSSFICSSVRLESLPTRKWTKEFAEKVGEAARKDKAYQHVRKELEQEAALEEGNQRMDRKARSEIWENGLLYRNGRL